VEISADRSSATLGLTFSGQEEREAFYREALAARAFLLKLTWEPRVGSEWTVSCEGSVDLPVRVVQLYDTVGAFVGVAFEILSWSEEIEAGLRRGAGEVVASPAPEGDEEDPEAAEPGEEEEEEDVEEGEHLGSSTIHRIRAMNVPQRAMLAMKGDRAERRILLRDGSPQVLQGLLANPRIEPKEILQLVKSTHVTAAILQRVAGDARWGKNLEVVTAVSRHPQTPSPLAIGLLERLRTSDLRLMGKMSGGLRENVRRAALREYLKRTSREPR
jgi:hypothetical protein